MSSGGGGSRYGDAYRVASGLEAVGALIKVFGFVVAGLAALAGIAVGSAAGNASSPFGNPGAVQGITTVAYLLGAAIHAFISWAAGTVVSALGQLVRCSADTATNTGATAEATQGLLAHFRSLVAP